MNRMRLDHVAIGIRRWKTPSTLNDDAFGVSEHHHDDDGGGNAGDQGADTRTGSAHAEAEDEEWH